MTLRTDKKLLLSPLLTPRYSFCQKLRCFQLEAPSSLGRVEHKQPEAGPEIWSLGLSFGSDLVLGDPNGFVLSVLPVEAHAVDGVLLLHPIVQVDDLKEWEGPNEAYRHIIEQGARGLIRFKRLTSTKKSCGFRTTSWGTRRARRARASSQLSSTSFQRRKSRRWRLLI